ncbi:nucleoside 2-deoxyribosyltransferase [bacterium BMS3Abin03]|nr:nucleoside 2-deoxyribosyltransferase [bacterium BMS3Abin03]HDZ59147.1 hypothetical protein [Ignavibacteriales bacterium]
MIIYCAGPINGDTTYQKNYVEIIKLVESQGHTALAELNGKFHASIPLSDNQIYTRDLKWINGSRLMIAEISGPSLGVGFEIAYALFEKKIPVLALALNEVKKMSAMITGCNSDLLTFARYNSLEDLQSIIFKFIKDLNKENDGKGIHLSSYTKTL